MRKRGWEKCVFLACLFMVAACGGGEGGESAAPATPLSARVTLSDSTRDTSQGKVIIVDYQGPAVTSGSSVQVTVGDTVVSGLFAGNSIYLTLPLSESGQTTASFDFGGFSASLSLNIAEAQTIRDPQTYVSDQVDDLISQFASLRSEGYQREYDDLVEVKKQLSNLSEEEMREFAILFKQNLEPLLALEQTAGQSAAVRGEYPDGFAVPRFLVSQECNEAVFEFLKNRVVVGWGIAAFAIGTKIAPASPILAGSVAAVSAAVILYKTIRIVRTNLDKIWDVCIGARILELEGFNALDGRRVTAESLGYFPDGGIPRAAGALEIAAQDSEERLQFVDDIPRELAISQASRIRHERRAELLEGLSKIRELVVSANRVSGGRLQSLVDALDRYVERSTPADASGIRLSGITNDNIAGTITAAESNKLTLKFEFANAEAVNSYVDFDFTLSSTIEGVDDMVVNGRLMPMGEEEQEQEQEEEESEEEEQEQQQDEEESEEEEQEQQQDEEESEEEEQEQQQDDVTMTFCNQDFGGDGGSRMNFNVAGQSFSLSTGEGKTDAGLNNYPVRCECRNVTIPQESIIDEGGKRKVRVRVGGRVIWKFYGICPDLTQLLLRTYSVNYEPFSESLDVDDNYYFTLDAHKSRFQYGQHVTRACGSGGEAQNNTPTSAHAVLGLSSIVAGSHVCTFVTR